MPIYRIFCDNCGLDTYIATNFKPNKCPKCGGVIFFQASRDEEEPPKYTTDEGTEGD